MNYVPYPNVTPATHLQSSSHTLTPYQLNNPLPPPTRAGPSHTHTFDSLLSLPGTLTQLRHNLRSSLVPPTLLHHQLVASLLSLHPVYCLATSSPSSQHAALLAALVLVLATVPPKLLQLKSGKPVLREWGEKVGVYPYVVLLVASRASAERVQQWAVGLTVNTGVRVAAAADG